MGGVMSSIVVSGDTSGAITIAAPAVAGTNTLTLPAATGTVLTTGSPQSGGIIQVVQGTYGSGANATTSTYIDSGLSVSITPKFSTSKILIQIYCGQCYKSAADTQLNLRIMRDSTSIYTAASLNQGTATALVTNPTLIYLDSPATSSAITYKLQFANRDNAGTISVNQNGTSVIILQEVAA